MYNLLGLSGNPFGEGFDQRLFWENRQRKELLETGARLLRESRNVWVRGNKGSGRSWFIQKLLGEGTSKSTPVLFAGGELPGETLPFILSLLDAISPGETPATLQAAAEKLYTKLLRRFWQGGTIVAVPGTSPLRGEGALREVIHLSSARVKGKPLCAFLLCGETPPPSPDFCILELPSFSPEELAECLRHRAEAFGKRDIIPPAGLGSICGSAGGIGDAMELASAHLHRMLFDQREAARGEKPEERRKPVLPEDQVLEIGRLLDAISSENPT